MCATGRLCRLRSQKAKGDAVFGVHRRDHSGKSSLALESLQEAKKAKDGRRSFSWESMWRTPPQPPLHSRIWGLSAGFRLFQAFFWFWQKNNSQFGILYLKGSSRYLKVQKHVKSPWGRLISLVHGFLTLRNFTAELRMLNLLKSPKMLWCSLAP